jgi:signal transduction histidine kinase
MPVASIAGRGAGWHPEDTTRSTRSLAMTTTASRILRPVADPETYAGLLFLATALPLGALALAVLFAGWLVTGLLVITPLVVPALLGFAGLLSLVAWAEGGLARGLLRARGAPAPGLPPARGFWRRGWAVLADARFWSRQAYLLLRVLLGWPMAIVQLTLVATALGWIGAPLYYRWIPEDGRNGLDFGIWKADTFPKALLLVPAGVVVLVLALRLVRPLAEVWRRLADTLLGGTMAELSAIAFRRIRRRLVAVHAAAALGVGALLVVVWALTRRDEFWPVWPLLSLALPLGINAWVLLLAERPELWRRKAMTFPLAVQLGVSAAVVLFLAAVWAAAGGGTFWPVWPLLGLAIPAVLHWGAVLLRGEDALARRVRHLETSRAGVVDVQEADLRRIERDLHDGAQARLVALGMSLGMAEQKLAADPDAARELVSEARLGVGEALRELRDLARGIRPPVLADRGLEAAIAALVDRSPLDVRLTVDVEPRPGGTVETAAYFVVAESLTNAAKHAEASAVEIRLSRRKNVLVVEVADDGAGGADPTGAGLVGLRRRVEALDGTFAVTSPPGGPTLVHVELPCAS